MEKLLERCNSCKSGSCCQEGVEITEAEIKKIEELGSVVAKPWFKVMCPEDNPDPGYLYKTIVREGRCVFQGADKKCRVYAIRPKNCAEFPLEEGKLAQYYHDLCDNR